MSTKFVEMCNARRAAGKHVCVGLDPDLDQIPDCVPGSTDVERVYNFLIAIVDATHEFAECYKPQIAYYEELRADGLTVLAKVISYIKQLDPSIPVILDFKRGDIDRTNEGYVEAAFGFYGADAVTVHPYLGLKAMQPFVDCADKTIFVLCRTSNDGAEEFQDFVGDAWLSYSTNLWYTSEKMGTDAGDEGPFFAYKMPMYEYVARRVAGSWNAKNRNCALVVGATYPAELEQIRGIVEDLPILIPGVGTQGGNLAKAVEYGSANDALGVINSSSAISGAWKKAKNDDGSVKYQPEQWAEAAGDAARAMNDDITAILANLANV